MSLSVATLLRMAKDQMNVNFVRAKQNAAAYPGAGQTGDHEDC